jgi:hypothetical protein
MAARHPAACKSFYSAIAETAIASMVGLGTGKAQRYFAFEFDRVSQC